MAMTWLLGRSGAVPRLGIGSRHKLLLGTGLLILLVFLFNLVNVGREATIWENSHMPNSNI